MRNSEPYYTLHFMRISLIGPRLLTHENREKSDDELGAMGFPKHATGSTDRCHHLASFLLPPTAEPVRRPSRTPHGREIKSSTRGTKDGSLSIESATPTQPLCVRDGLAVFSALHHVSDVPRASRKTPNRLVCVDTRTRAQLGTAYVDGSSDLSTLEVPDCCVSADGTQIAVVINLTSNYVNNSSRVVVYDAANWREAYTLVTAAGKQAVALAFHPSFGHSRLSVAYHANADSCLSVVSFDLPHRQTIQCETIKSLYDADDTSYTMIYSRGGAFIVMQLISAVWRSRDSLCETLVVDSETLRALYRCEPVFVSLCHNECLSTVRPTLSECGGYFAFNTCDESSQKAPATRVFRLPVTVQLFSQCRVAILKCLNDSSYVKTLPLPDKLKDFLFYCPDYI